MAKKEKKRCQQWGCLKGTNLVVFVETIIISLYLPSGYLRKKILGMFYLFAKN